MKTFISAFKKDRTFRENFKNHLHLKECLHNYSPFVVEAIGGYVYDGDTEATEEISCIVDINPEIIVNIAKMFQQETIMVTENDRALFINVETSVHSEVLHFVEIDKAEIGNYKGHSIIGDKVYVTKKIEIDTKN